MAEAPCLQPPCEGGAGATRWRSVTRPGLAVAGLVGADAALVRRQLAAGRDRALRRARDRRRQDAARARRAAAVRSSPGYVVERPQAYMAPAGRADAGVASRAHRAGRSPRAAATSPTARRRRARRSPPRWTARRPRAPYASIDDPPKPPEQRDPARGRPRRRVHHPRGRGDQHRAVLRRGPRRPGHAGRGRRRAAATARAGGEPGAADRRRRLRLGVLVGTFVAYTLRATTGAPGLRRARGRTSPRRRSSSRCWRCPWPRCSRRLGCRSCAARRSGKPALAGP